MFQFTPALTVLKVVPESPTIMQVFGSAKDRELRFLVVWLTCEMNEVPPFAVINTTPPSPQKKPVLTSRNSTPSISLYVML